MLRLKVYSVKNRNRNQCKETRPFNDLIASFLLTSIIKKRKNNKTLQTNTESITIKRTIIPSFWWLPQSRTLLNVFLLFSFFAMRNAQCKWTMGKSDKKHHENCKHDWFLHPSHCIGHYLSKYEKNSVCCCLIFAGLQKCKNTVTPRPDIPPQSYFFFFPIYSEVPNWFGNGVPFR